MSRSDQIVRRPPLPAAARPALRALALRALALRALALRALALGALALGALTVSLTPSALANSASTVLLSPAAQQDFEAKYGARDGAELSQYFDRALAKALADRGLDPDALRIETTIVSLTPDHPTFKQLSDRPSLDYLRSVSLGGADLKARLIGKQGQTVGEVCYSWTARDLRDGYGLATWGSAEYAIEEFARRVAALYAAKM